MVVTGFLVLCKEQRQNDVFLEFEGSNEVHVKY